MLLHLKWTNTPNIYNPFNNQKLELFVTLHVTNSLQIITIYNISVLQWVQHRKLWPAATYVI